MLEQITNTIGRKIIEEWEKARVAIPAGKQEAMIIRGGTAHTGPSLIAPPQRVFLPPFPCPYSECSVAGFVGMVHENGEEFDATRWASTNTDLLMQLRPSQE